MVKTIINTEDASQADVVLVSAAYEKTASSHKGTVHGPEKIIQCLDSQIEFFDRDLKINASDHLKIAHADLGNLENLTPEETLKTIREKCESLKDKFVFLLGGEHSVCIGAFQALSKQYSPAEVTILQIDAHCDLRENDADYSDTPSDLAHSTVMRHASSLGFPIVQVGIRTYSEDEYNYFNDKKNNVTVFEWGQKEIPTIEQILASVKTKYLYITIDVDGFDPAHMPGTGTPVQGGLEWWYGLELIDKLINNFELIGADIVEVSPMKDSVLTEYGAAQLCYSIIAKKFEKKLR